LEGHNHGGIKVVHVKTNTPLSCAQDDSLLAEVSDLAESHGTLNFCIWLNKYQFPSTDMPNDTLIDSEKVERVGRSHKHYVIADSHIGSLGFTVHILKCLFHRNYAAYFVETFIKYIDYVIVVMMAVSSNKMSLARIKAT